jgi:hypothetical protein
MAGGCCCGGGVTTTGGTMGVSSSTFGTSPFGSAGCAGAPASPSEPVGMGEAGSTGAMP